MSTVAAAPSPTRHNRRAGPGAPHAGEPLGSYADGQGHKREIVCCPGANGSRLVIDRLAGTLGDPRLVAHLCVDEPAENARVVSALYLAEERGRRCRPLKREDFHAAPLELGETQLAIASEGTGAYGPEVVDRHGRTYRLASAPVHMSIPELRWFRYQPRGEPGCAELITVREAIGSLESYEPVRSLTARALVAHHRDQDVSVTALRAELERMSASRVVLNRGLRDAVLAVVGGGDLTMSEIAIRCGRAKRDARGNASGETSWLGRRLGLLAEGGKSAPTPWVHSDVLALIARSGLGVAPRDVEVG
jgi:hypothetical protein